MPSFNPSKYFWDWEFMGKISEMVRRGGAEAGKRSGLETQDVLWGLWSCRGTWSGKGLLRSVPGKAESHRSGVVGAAQSLGGSLRLHPSRGSSMDPWLQGKVSAVVFGEKGFEKV